VHFPTWLIGPLNQAGRWLYGRLEYSYGIKVEVDNGVVGHPLRGSTQYVLVTVYNSTDRPEKVESVALALSSGGVLLMFHDPRSPFPAPPRVITRTDNFVYGFPAETIRESLEKTRKEMNNPKVHVSGARASLASGRMVWVKKRIDV